MLVGLCIDIVRDAARRVTDSRRPLSALKARAESHEDFAERRRAVSAVARRGRRDPAIESWLKVRAQVDADLFVRERAMRELVSRWKAAPDGLTWLIDTALSAEPHLKRLAWEALAAEWKNDLQVITTLETRILAQANAEARDDALQRLAGQWRGHPQVSSWLMSLAISSPTDSIRRRAGLALAESWSKIPGPSSHIAEHMRSGGVVERCRTLDLIGLIGPDVDNWPFLKNAATTDANPHVRGIALGVLARPRWNQHAEAARIVIRLARFDAHWAVRRDAVQALARSWPRGPQTVSVLIELARGDAGWVVRRAALRELIVGWKDHPDTLAIVTEFARTDRDPPVRETAIHALARRWWKDPNTLPLLKTCARPDEPRSVRTAAVAGLIRLKRWRKDAGVQQLYADYRASASTTR